ncbi:MAG: lytic transglycosylase domain-containing protein [Lentimicrobiaceae bacterium]|nr:lytic transglycosylase domain-containing protein [Lentimicrobiaceae bacterium]
MKLKIITIILGLIICGFGNPLVSPPLPDQIDFCGEKVPLHLYWVKEGLDRELTIQCYQHSRTLQTLKRSTRFFPVIEKILKEENVPDDLKYLCIAESNLENVVSPAKAAGFWQFMEATGKSYGLEINEHVDERYHLEKATRAACVYLKKLKNQFGSWSLAAAAYNMGENGLLKNMNEQQVDSYWDLFLNQETSRYVNRCVAYKLIFENQELYNIQIADHEFYKPIHYKELIVVKSIEDLRTYCTKNNILYRQIKELNPWLRSTKLLVHGGKSYTIKVPVD